jgi:leucyl-tRNA synthetase
MNFQLDGRFKIVNTPGGQVIGVVADAAATSNTKATKSATAGKSKGAKAGAGATKPAKAPAAAAKGGEGAGSTKKRDRLVEIERQMQDTWESERLFEANAEPGKPKFMATFPFPYMNGRLHLGHAFSMSKVEFATAYHRVRGDNVLFPFGFHCTGMPIQAAANKLRRELEAPKGGAAPTASSSDGSGAPAAAVPGKFKSNKSKAAAKTGGAKKQSEILRMVGVTEEEIPSFVEPEHWLHYFCPRGKQDLQALGVGVDWRRSFITTDVNPYFDSFVRWQFLKLKEGGFVEFGQRPCIYSILDGQACADHDRSSGEGVGPQEYTLIKMRALATPPALEAFADRKIFLVAATLRPETMYGQTNCFVLPEGEYGAYEMANGEVFVCSERSALNMSYQGLTATRGEPVCLATMEGTDLLGLPVRAPLCTYERVYVLPLLTISMGKGTGVVTSVPSDAPDDYAALRDLKEKPKLREKFGITAEMVEPFEVVPIINIPGYGETAAVTLCDKLKIKSQNDKAKLKEAKAEVYLKGFYEGVMLVGSQAGKTVQEAKPVVREELLKTGEAAPYYEPEKEVISRSGDECVVAFLDQWYLAYGEEEWAARVQHWLDNGFEAYTKSTAAQFQATLGWLKEWACSRSFGLGTKLPWDEQFVIEALSDSTIYMAYYTVCHLLQGGIMDGSAEGPAAIPAEKLTVAVWDYIMLGGAYPAECGVPEATLTKLRGEFEYWYPMDLRSSGKDLIRNHLTMSLYNHAAIWKDDLENRMPRSFFTNGHILVNGKKMSKSEGTFLLVNESVDRWGADAVRFAMADGGDTNEDANYEMATGDSAILRLTNEEEFIKSVVEGASDMRTGGADGYNFMDQVFEARINAAVHGAAKGYETMMIKSALASGFYELQSARDSYRDGCKKQAVPMHRDVVMRFIKVQLALLAPICPHFCDYMWRHVVKLPGTALKGSWPEAAPVDEALLARAASVDGGVKKFRADIAKWCEPMKRKGKVVSEGRPWPTKAVICVAKSYPAYQQRAIEFLNSAYDEETNSFPPTCLADLRADILSVPEFKRFVKPLMAFAGQLTRAATSGQGRAALATTTAYDELALWASQSEYVAKALDLETLVVVDVNDTANPDVAAIPQAKRDSARPGNPICNAS